MTQLMARTTTLLDGRKSVTMNPRRYTRAILPIGVFFSLSLICGNIAYLYLSVAFIQMLKATTPVAVLLATWAFGLAKPEMRTLANVSVIVLGVVLASFGEIRFVLTGVLFQIGGIVFEAVRLVMVQRLLTSADSKMDPLVSLYYFAPVCTLMNGLVALVWEVPKLHMAEVHAVGYHIFLANALVAFALNVSVVFLIGRTSSLVLTLCGVLKDILLVIASVLIWGTVVTPLQIFGYVLALGGLIYYKLGSETIKLTLQASSQGYQTFRSQRPRLVKFLWTAGILLAVYGMIKAFAPEAEEYARDYSKEAGAAALLAMKEKYKSGWNKMGGANAAAAPNSGGSAGTLADAATVAAGEAPPIGGN
jgi:drug/metabolite transporter (DMT)-like permease